MDGVGNAAWFGARAMDVLETQFSHLVKTVRARGHAAGHHDHVVLPLLSQLSWRGIALAHPMLRAQPRAFFGIAARGCRRRLDDHLDIARVGDRQHAETEPAAEIAITRVALAALAADR